MNVIELAPKGTGKSYVFGNLSKYGWLVSGGKVTRAKLFYDKQKQQNGIIKIMTSPFLMKFKPSSFRNLQRFKQH